MPAVPALAAILRCLAFGVLIAVMLVKPALAFASEAGEPVAAAVASAHPGQPADAAPAAPHDEDGCDDTRWHLSHCCAMQAALLPRIQLGLSVERSTAPLPASAGVDAIRPTATPFRPPIRA
ncbi:hypothetical protein [Lysobacter antibioticus]|uniref:hypothetical protein n=1 Tax=Lysobacter antibioticus TaxID=84531 RepID=UPI0007E8C4D0|nr:hypothetical protein [Lysobacter antibioticus]